MNELLKYIMGIGQDSENSEEEPTVDGSLEGHLLIATPKVSGGVFTHSVIYICTHTDDGAMGFIINNAIHGCNPSDIFQQLKLDAPEGFELPLFLGGPMEFTRGFVLHSDDYDSKNTIQVQPNIAMTSNIEILRDIIGGKGPKNSMLTLGHAGWAGGQLEEEIKENCWLTIPATREIVFDTPPSSKWETCNKLAGIDQIYSLSPMSGNA